MSKRWRSPSDYQPEAAVRTSVRSFGDQNELNRLRRRAQIRGWLVFIPMCLGAALLGTAYGAGWAGFGNTDAVALSASPTRAQFSLCFVGGGTNCVVDGDTIWLAGEKIRIADIDAPETHDPRCAGEKALGDRASQRLRDLLNGGAVTLQSINRDQDRYGRKLRIVSVDGTSVGDTLVGEGLARWYGSGRRRWC